MRDNLVMKVQEIETFYRLSHILFSLSLEIRHGEVTCLLGRNGAGKTTTMRSIAGLSPPKAGHIFFLGKDITRTPAHLIARQGLICAFSEKRVFDNLTVKENLEIGRRTPAVDEGTDMWNLERIYSLFPVLKNKEKRWAKNLSGGEQQMVCVARALMGNPKLLLLDEPTIGLAPVVIDTIAKNIRELKEEGISILLTEQNFRFAMELGNQCYVIDVGEIRFQGTFDELSKNEDIINTYLAV